MKDEDKAIQLLLEAVDLKYGYNFKDYSKASIRRRVLGQLRESGLGNLAEMQQKAVQDRSFFARLLSGLTVNVTEMFRDAFFYQAVREKVFPLLETYPFIRIWVAGCSTGEEVYSLAILLKEAGLYERVQIYATDINEEALLKARQGVYAIDKMKSYINNYQKAGGQESFVDYYTARYNWAVMRKDLKKNLTFAAHNLATDGMFNEMHLITCRNVLIYFNAALKNRIYGLFAESLCYRGFLCLGSKESLQFSNYDTKFEVLEKQARVYRKRRLER